MACGNESVVDQQGAYVSALTATSKFAREGRTLTLLDPFGAPVLVFRAAADNPPTDQVLLRIRSELPIGIEQATVRIEKGTVRYGSLAPGKDSDYAAANRVYSYASVTLVTTDGDEFGYRPTDYTDETPLPPGRYTYVLSLSPSGEASDHLLNVRLGADQ